MTLEEYRKLKKKRSKYGNKKTVLDGIVFDSAKEARRWQELQILEKADVISLLQRQPVIRLEVNGIKICDYRPDFIFFEGKKEIVEDVKSKPTMTPVYRLKKKLLFALKGIEIREI